MWKVLWQDLVKFKYFILTQVLNINRSGKCFKIACDCFVKVTIKNDQKSNASLKPFVDLHVT